MQVWAGRNVADRKPSLSRGELQSCSYLRSGCIDPDCSIPDVCPQGRVCPHSCCPSSLLGPDLKRTSVLFRKKKCSRFISLLFASLSDTGFPSISNYAKHVPSSDKKKKGNFPLGQQEAKCRLQQLMVFWRNASIPLPI